MMISKGFSFKSKQVSTKKTCLLDADRTVRIGTVLVVKIYSCN